MTDRERLRNLAENFHNAYERLAPEYGYETREETREFDPDSPNGRLMIAVCALMVRPLLDVAEAADYLDRNSMTSTAAMQQLRDALAAYREAGK